MSENRSKKRKNESIDESESESEEEVKSKNKKNKSNSNSDDDEECDYKEKKNISKLKTKQHLKHEKSPSKEKKNEKNDKDIYDIWEGVRDRDQKWKTLSHNGPLLPKPYRPLPTNIKFYYNKKPLKLSLGAEEVAGFYARMLDNKNLKKAKFKKNFFDDWKQTMTAEEEKLITNLKLCDFTHIAKYYKEESEKKKESKKEMSEKKKQEIERENEEVIRKYGYCIVDGVEQKIGNFKIEPPGLFCGRGNHPKIGKLKKRILPEDIIINIGRNATVPQPPAGHRWKEVRHDSTVTWLASWNENIMGKLKYIMLSPSSKLKSYKDFIKYEKARKLKDVITNIREEYEKNFKSKDMLERQRAVALYFIDQLALRAGNEKEMGESSDTVGCCSLRVEHIKLKKNGQQFILDFDFLGKDSIRYRNSVKVKKTIYECLIQIKANKSEKDYLFDQLTTWSLNKYLNLFMEGLTAKVFRTFNASNTLQEKLNEYTKRGMTEPQLLSAYNSANRDVAVLCNHQRTVPKMFDKQMERMGTKIKDKKKQIKKFRKEMEDSDSDNDSDSDSSSESDSDNRDEQRLTTLEKQLSKLEIQKSDKIANKEIALGTSKLNYLDPRISVSWCNKWNVPIHKIYNKSQRDRFSWAVTMVDKDYKF